MNNFVTKHKKEHEGAGILPGCNFVSVVAISCAC
jgi:hypothetical protein